MFGKPLASLTRHDIDRLCKEQARESDVVEFKEALTGKGGPDGWHAGADRIGEGARDRIVNELVAFANAHGGTLVLGIAETDDKPARAANVCPIPRCADLAERLSRALADTVEPPFAPFPTIVPVPIDGDAGIIVFQVAASRGAPHRHRSTLQSYVRRGEQAVPMTMREIQDLTLQVERGLAHLEREFAGSVARFNTVCGMPTGLALRATAVPLAPISAPIPNDKAFNPQFRRFRGTFGSRDVDVVVPHSPTIFTPALRAIRAVNLTPDGSSVTAAIASSGLVEIFFARRIDERLSLYVGWFAGLACNAMSMIDEVRAAAGAPGTEYGLELAVYAPVPIPAATYGGREYDFDLSWNVGSTTFPRYSIGDRSQFVDVMELFDRDFWNAIGKVGGSPLRIAF